MVAVALHKLTRTSSDLRPDARRSRRLALVAAAGIIAGCATSGPTPQGAVAPVPDGGILAPSHYDAAGDALYKLLAAEIAGHRGDIPFMLDSYIEVARETRNAGVAERAVGVSALAGANERAIEAARLWSEIDPSSIEAIQARASLLIRIGDLDGAVERLEDIVKASPDSPREGLSRISTLLAKEQNRHAAIAAMKRLVTKREDDPAAQFALAFLLTQIGRLDEASKIFDRAFELDPDNAQTAIISARVRQSLNDAEGALDLLAEYLDRVPDSTTVRMTYARVLSDSGHIERARAEFERIVANDPGNDDARYALGLTLMQMNQLNEAAQQFEKLTSNRQWRDTAHYHLAQIAQSQQRIDDAIAFYQRVRRGEHRLSAQLKAAVLLAERGDLESARRHLHRLRGADIDELMRIYLTEAELLVDAGRPDDAMAVYDASIEELFAHSDLLFARAMLAEKIGRLDIFERDMRDILSREPNNADALNTLGYVLADRTDRYKEAYEFIRRAFDLKPNTHYIVDSMGWILHRMGRHREALDQLRRAMSIFPDPEIAAHLGEVLWVLGEKDEAREVWNAALETAPNDELLLNVIKRFGP